MIMERGRPARAFHAAPTFHARTKRSVALLAPISKLIPLVILSREDGEGSQNRGHEPHAPHPEIRGRAMTRLSTSIHAANS
jgi:hypothetical protein